MTEIGSEFWNVPLWETDNGIFPAQTRWFRSGRDALRAIIRDIAARRPLRSVGLPSWCCDSMIGPFRAAGADIRFYPVYRDGAGRFVNRPDHAQACDAVLVMDYFGFAGPKVTVDGPVVIRDATHSVFCGEPWESDYVFGSLRKWAGFWTGGFAYRRGGWTTPAPEEQDRPYVSARAKSMDTKAAYMADPHGPKDHLALFARAEQMLEETSGVAAAAERDVLCARRLDAAFLTRRRRENAKILLEGLRELPLFPELGERDCPLFVPIIVPGGQRDRLRAHLIERDIYCPVHWPVTPLHRLTEQTEGLYSGELSLLCDQRYTGGDMETIVSAVREFFRS